VDADCDDDTVAPGHGPGSACIEFSGGNCECPGSTLNRACAAPCPAST
jgi:hypothetical protein